MPRKRKAAKQGKKVAGRAAALATDPCNTGDEINSTFVFASPNAAIELRMAVCGSSALAVVDFDGERVFSQTIAGVAVLPLQAPSAIGDYLLLWALVPTAATWRAQGEVATETAPPPAALAVQFRHRKASDSAVPVPKWAVFVRVR